MKHCLGKMGMLLLVLGLFSAQVASQLLLSKTPASIPIVVRTPYFNSWLPFVEGSSPIKQWPTDWPGRILGWAGVIRVDDVAYQWMGVQGATDNFTMLLESYSTPTRSIFVVKAGAVQFNVTFLSPIEPSDWIRQSFPFAYMYIDVASMDGRPHSVQLYSDVTGEFISSDFTNIALWNTTQTNSVIYHQISRSQTAVMEEDNDMSEDGTLYFGMAKSDRVTWQTGNFTYNRATFAASGSLLNTVDIKFRQINNAFPVLSISVDLGNIIRSDSPVVWAIGHVRSPVIRYFKEKSFQNRVPYFLTRFSNVQEAIDDFVGDFPNAVARATSLDNNVTSDGLSISQDYADLLAISLRQTLGSLEITTSEPTNGQWDPSDIAIIMKDIGNGRRVNPVDVIYAALPALLYLNSSLVEYLLDPLLDYQQSLQVQPSFAAPDLGVSYPKALGNGSQASTADLGVESSGNMLIMVLAHALKSGNKSLMNRYYEMLRGWADYLAVQLPHTNGTSGDGLDQPDMSNLALKGILGVYALAKINQALGKSEKDSSYYMTSAVKSAEQWEDLAFSGDHVVSTYGNNYSWGILYNLYAARLLNADIISNKIYESQTAWYARQDEHQFGLPYDSNRMFAVKSHWTLFAAAAATDEATRDLLISKVHNRAFFYKGSNLPFPSTYDTTSDDPKYIKGMASPAQGAMFALLATKIPNLLSIDDTPLTPDKKKSHAGAIAGGVIAGILVPCVCVAAIYYRRRRTRHNQRNNPTTIPFHLDFSSLPALEIRSAPTVVIGEGGKGSSGSTSKHGRVDTQSSLPSTQENSPSDFMRPVTILGSPTLYSPIASPVSPNDVSAMRLHNQVEELRQVLEQIQVQQTGNQPPPQYQD